MTETIEQLAEQPATWRDVPALPDGAPSLARHLAWALKFIGCLQPPMTLPGDLESYGEAIAALEAIEGVAAPTQEIGGKRYWARSDGSLIPDDLVKAEHRLEDEVVRRIATGALGVSGILGRYKAYSMAEVYGYVELLAQEYGGGKTGKGSVTLGTYDGTWRVQIASADKITFGPEIHVARGLLLDYLAAEPGSDALKAVVQGALGLDRQASIRPREVLRLRAYEIGHETWQEAMRAIDASLRSSGTARYLRVYCRDEGGRWVQVPLDLASV